MSDKDESVNKNSRFVSIGILLSTAAMVVFIAAFGYGYSQLAKVNMSLANMLSDLQSQAVTNKKEIQSLQQELQGVQASAAKAQELSTKQEQMITSWQEAQKGNFEKWHVAEAEYLVRLANDHVVFTHNTLMALTLLQRADKILGGLNDQSLIPIRKSIAGDIANLVANPQVDTTQLYLILASLNDQIMNLPLPVGPMQKSDDASVAIPGTETTWWRAGLNNTWNALKKIVIVRYNASNKSPLVLPEEREFLYQNLRSQIETAIWAALHNDREIYLVSLTQAMAWVREYFLMTAPETQTMLKRLEALRNLNVQPSKANLTPTLQLFDEYLGKSGQQMAMR